MAGPIRKVNPGRGRLDFDLTDLNGHVSWSIDLRQQQAMHATVFFLLRCARNVQADEEVLGKFNSVLTCAHRSATVRGSGHPTRALFDLCSARYCSKL